MSAIARYYKFKGLDVSGYDRTPSELTHKLEAEGIRVHYEDRPDLVPSDKEETLVVYTPAIPQDLGELRKVMDEGYTVLKRSRTLGEITRGQRCLAVAGTHGKTTTSTLTAHILTQTGAGCSAFLGGISRNYGTNLLMSRNETVVVEADEFDRSFLQLFPEIAVITSVEADHLDIYGDYAHVVEAFRAFASQVSGTLIVKKGAPVSQEHTQAKVLTYHYKDTSADFYAADAHPDARCGFAQQPPHAELKLVDDHELLRSLPDEMRKALEQTLCLDPRPQYQHDPHRTYTLPFGQWEVRFRVDEPWVEVIELSVKNS